MMKRHLVAQVASKSGMIFLFREPCRGIFALSTKAFFKFSRNDQLAKQDSK